MPKRTREPDPTPRQIEYLATIARLTKELGRSPSASEIAAEMGITRIGARQQLRALEAQGLLLDEPIVVSSGKWKLTPTGRRLLTG